MVENLTIRRALRDDVPALADLRVALALEDGTHVDVADYRARCRSFFSRTAHSDDVLAWLALVGTDAVGIAVLELRATLPRARSLRDPAVDGRVRSVFVRPNYRRRGIGTALVRETIAAAQAARVDRLTLGASAMGVPLYEALGFVLREREMIWRGPSGEGPVRR